MSMRKGFRRSSLVIGLTIVFLVTTAFGCGNPQPPAKPGNAAPSSKPKQDSKEAKPPEPDPG
jgi:hypothetical protein